MIVVGDQNRGVEKTQCKGAEHGEGVVDHVAGDDAAQSSIMRAGGAPAQVE